MNDKKDISQMITKTVSKHLLHHAANSINYCWMFFGEPKKSTQITQKNIEQCLKKLER